MKTKIWLALSDNDSVDEVAPSLEGVFLEV
jgi:hypothetical protein